MLLRILLGIIIISWSGWIMATEEPKYKVIEDSEPFELRLYEPIIIAETWVSGEMKDASSAGFKKIANYIFGNNTSRKNSSKTSEKIEMTAPVTMEASPAKEPSSEKISMTAPVTMEQVDNQWRVHFVMPSEYTMDTLPNPNSSDINIREIPERQYAVIRFSGLVDKEKAETKTDELMKWMESKGLLPKGEPQLARYNPPWTLPMFRRNEVMINY